ncbi:nucleoside hydrolase [Mycobacterium kubicae]|uniref:Nucleoside hydrolase n=1 Tax=Mycobacterium kubicae TaxID=120959 RepID=A0AAX1JF94_9MYCO|nr:nucleoside hydrolase [Mycobacterium kubicae]MCV7096749.1 nucleoside hydrolase [Mycobacterium kubicae]ORW01622.1 nucleoside hydrolase [Mycobacterium kubicae]QNI10821.1 nucleoside hydrolase [Mycobacterium kubicae]QPI39030.1 nucleoside hydrolase [Mycobacterium kubicae]GFG63082.1 nucleoside hydrolase [Mycobacterium kubicae]
MSAVFVDVDTGIDDAMALLYLLGSAEVIGIAATGGNIGVDQVCANNLGLLEVCRAPDIPVSRGADQPLHGIWSQRASVHGPNGLGYATLPPTERRLTDYDATTAWVVAARAHPGELIGVVTGPLTNLALAVRAEPALPTLLRRLVIMGGAFDEQIDSAAEWNIRVDPEAADEVLTAWTGRQRLPVLCGLDLTRQVAMTPEILDRLTSAAGPSALTAFIEDVMRCYFESHAERGYGYLAYLHDPLAAAAALEPQLISTRAATVTVTLTEPRGKTVADWSGDREPNARIGIGVDSAAFFDRYIEVVGRFARAL